MKLIAATSIALLLSACNGHSPSSQIAPSTLQKPTVAQAVRNASLVARIKITSEKPTFGRFGACGKSYGAIVTRSYKGNESNISFFSANDSFYRTENAEYLIIAFSSQNLKIRLEESDGPQTIPDDKGHDSCGVGDKYFVSTLLQTVLEFDANASRRFGGEWLRPRNGYVQGSIVTDPRYSYIDISKGRQCGNECYVFRWEDIEADILKSLE